MEFNQITQPRKAFLENVFKHIISLRHHDVPDWPTVSRFPAEAKDGISVFGWGYCPNTYPIGSLLFLHGFTGSSRCQHLWEYVREISHRYDFAVGGCDFRHHGMSDDALSTFGMAESWMSRRFLSWRKIAGFLGLTFFSANLSGEMAAQVSAATNPKVDAAFLMALPAWPWQAIDHYIGHNLHSAICLPDELDRLASPFRKLLKGAGLGVYDTINDHYSEHQVKILDSGCLFNHDCSPAHDPLVLYLMGSDDEYGIEHTRKVWGHWYREESARLNARPSESPKQKNG